MSSQSLQADADALRGLATTVSGYADTIAGLDPAAAASAGAEAMKDTVTGAAVAGIADPVKSAYSAMGKTFHAMATTANSNANDYEATDRGFAQVLQTYGQGLR